MGGDGMTNETMNEYIERTIKEHVCSEDNIKCEVDNCDGCYVGLYWEDDEYGRSREDGSTVEWLVMQCCKCRDQIEI
jgi:hypothetical protein